MDLDYQIPPTKKTSMRKETMHIQSMVCYQFLYHGNNRTGAHIANKPREERSVFEVGIMLSKKVLRCL